jgi:hypothetical protein
VNSAPLRFVSLIENKMILVSKPESSFLLFLKKIKYLKPYAHYPNGD